MKLLRPAPTALALTLTMIAPTVWAQTPPAAPPAAVQAPPAGYAPPPAGYAPPPAGYALPPAGYAPPPAGYAPPPAGYAPPPAGYAPPPGYAYPSMYGSPAPWTMGPTVLPYKDGSPVPYGYHREARTRSGLVVGGAITFGLMYALAVGTASLSGEALLAVPLAGPFLQLGSINFSSGGDSPSFAGAIATVLVIDGLAQVAGAVMLVAGLTTKKQVVVRDGAAGATMRITPLTMGYGGMGIGIVGEM